MHLIRMYDMKYKEKVTYRTTASGGQEIITEQVPVYNKFEQFAKKKHDKRINKINGTKEGKPVKIPFILKHPGICALILGAFIILVVYLISSANTYMDELIKQYTSLTAKTNDSKYAFDKKLFYVTVEADGTKKITFGYKSEEQQEQAEEAADEAASTGNGPDSSNTGNGSTTPSGTIVTTNDAMDYIWNYFKGKGYCDEAIAGIMGSMWVETGGSFNPKIESRSGYYGLCQWDKNGRKAVMIAQFPSTYDTVEGQCDFVMFETEHNAGPGSTKCTASNMNDPYTFFSGKDSTVTSSSDKVELCTFLFCKYFEGCVTTDTNRSFANANSAYQHFYNRVTAAHNIYATYHK